MLTLTRDTIHPAFAKEDYIAREDRGTQSVLYYDTPQDRAELAKRLQAAGIKDTVPDKKGDCPGSKKECDQAGGCCQWITSGGFNYCKCV